MPRVPFTVTTFTTPDGNPLSFGYLIIRLSKDARTPDNGQLGAQITSRVNLDVNGVIAGSPTFWGNSAMIPADTVYILDAYTAQGAQVLSNIYIVVIGTGIGGFGIAFGNSLGS